MTSLLGGMRSGAALVLLAACASGTSDGSSTGGYPEELCPSCAEWNAPHPPFRIFGDTWYVGTEGLASVLIASSDGHVLIDGGLPESAALIEENVRALGFDLADVALIVVSHAHFDHAGGIAALQRASEARVMASPAGARAMRQGRSDPGDPQHGTLLDFPPVAGVEELPESGTLTLGALTLTAHDTPAHTPGGTTWTWRACDEERCLDLVFADSQTPISAEGFRFGTRPDLAEVERGFGVLESLPCDILITPHPGASSFWERRARSEGLRDPDACRRYAAAARARLAERLASEREGGVDSAPGADRPGPADRAFVALEGDGLRVFLSSSGSARPLPFGSTAVAALALLSAALGAEPVEQGTNVDCAADYARWDADLTVWFANGRFTGWSAGPASTLTTVDGLGPGATRAELEAVRDPVVAQSSLGEEFTVGGLAGLLESDRPDAPIRHLWSGHACIAR